MAESQAGGPEPNGRPKRTGAKDQVAAVLPAALAASREDRRRVSEAFDRSLWRVPRSKQLPPAKRRAAAAVPKRPSWQRAIAWLARELQAACPFPPEPEPWLPLMDLWSDRLRQSWLRGMDSYKPGELTREIRVPIGWPPPPAAVRAAFLEAWAMIDNAAGAGDQLGAAVAAADQAACPIEAERLPSRATRRLAAVCRELQRQAGGAAFFLDQRSAAAQMGIDKMTVNRSIRRLLAFGLLRRAEKGRRQRATRYNYLGRLT